MWYLLVVPEFLALGGVWPAVVQLGGGWVRSERGREWFLYGRSGEDKVREGTGGGRRGVYPCSAKGEGPIGGYMYPHWPGVVDTYMLSSLLFVECTRWPSSTTELWSIFTFW
jgi:hypothetical protein